MKKITLVVILAAAMLVLSGCGDFSKIPRVEITKNAWNYDTIYLPLRENYVFEEVPFSIVDVDMEHYDIIIHCEKERMK